MLAHILIWFLVFGEGSVVYPTLATGCLGVALLSSAAHILFYTNWKKLSFYLPCHHFTLPTYQLYRAYASKQINRRVIAEPQALFFVKRGLLVSVWLRASYLPDGEVKPDHGGVSSRVRPLHCTSLGLTSAIATSVSNSTVQFLVVGACVRARPLQTY